MKKAIITVIIVLSLPVFALATCYESEINPDVFKTWQVVDKLGTCPYGYVLMMEDPNTGQHATVISHPKIGLLSYSYVENGEVAVYGYDFQKKCYTRQPCSKKDAEIIGQLLYEYDNKV